MVQQQSHGSKQLQKELLDSCGLIIDGGCISHLPLACSLALYCAQSAGEVVSDLKVWLHWTVGNWVVLQAGLGVAAASMWSVCVVTCVPAHAGGGWIPTCDIFHSWCQSGNKALSWLRSLFSNKIHSRHAELSRWNEAVSTALVWDTRCLQETSRAPLLWATYAGMREKWFCAFASISKC